MSLRVYLSFAFTLASPVLAQVGTVLDQHKISSLRGNFAGPLHEEDYFGHGCAALGDLNRDGTPDLAVGAYGDDDGGPGRGAVWILFLAPDGSVASQTKISSTAGGFTGSLFAEAGFGFSLSSAGDLDGDGASELAVLVFDLNFPSPSRVGSSLWILFLGPDGSVRSQQEIRWSDPVFVPRPRRGHDFAGVAAIGDRDGDGVPDLAVTSPQSDDGPRTGTGCVWILRLNRDGSPKASHKISHVLGGGAGKLDRIALGASIAALGDLDGDGNGELAHQVYVNRQAAVAILFLDDGEELARVHLIRSQELGFPSVDSDFNPGGSLASLGDLDGDGLDELAIGMTRWPDPFVYVGSAFVAFLNRDGALRKSILITRGHGGFAGNLARSNYFGASLAGLGDLDGDGAAELAVGAYEDGDGGEEHGAVWILSLDGSAVRNGSGRNSITLRESAEPTIGHYWKLALDCGGHAPGLASIAAFEASHPGLRTPLGELLVDLTSRRFFRIDVPHSGTTASFVLAVPRDVALVGLPMYVQGSCTGAPRSQLSNALDVIIGRP